MGADRTTVQDLRIIRIDPANHLLLIQGTIPGAEQGVVMVKKSTKHPGVIKKPQPLQVIIEEDEILSKTAKAIAKKPK